MLLLSTYLNILVNKLLILKHFLNRSGFYNIVCTQTRVLLKYIFKHGNHKIKT